MTVFLVRQLHFANSEFLRCMEGVTDEEARQHIGQMNAISWIVGHLANHQHFLWVQAAQGKNLYPDLVEIAGYGSEASAPPLQDMWEIWRGVTASADEFLESLTDASLVEHMQFNDKPLRENIGTNLLRNTYHIWFHLGEVHAIRQQLGHKPPDFVGPFGDAAFTAEDINL